MNRFKLLTAAVISTFVLVSAGPVLANCPEGGCVPVDDDPKEKGNNGWGNGAEGTNAGSEAGGTEDTKSDETRDPGDTSPGPAKFTTR